MPVTEEAPKQSAAATAAEKVRVIIETAERTAAELEAAAREDAARIRGDAEREVESLVGRAREVAARIAERAEEVERQLAPIRAALASLAKDLEELRAEAAAPARKPDGQAESVELTAAREGEPVAAVAVTDERGDLDETIAEAQAAAARAPEIAEDETSGEGARLIALNMALRGTPRHETARYLAENFELEDPDALLDDVYARAGG